MRRGQGRGRCQRDCNRQHQGGARVGMPCVCHQRLLRGSGVRTRNRFSRNESYRQLPGFIPRRAFRCHKQVGPRISAICAQRVVQVAECMYLCISSNAALQCPDTGAPPVLQERSGSIKQMTPKIFSKYLEVLTRESVRRTGPPDPPLTHAPSTGSRASRSHAHCLGAGRICWNSCQDSRAAVAGCLPPRHTELPLIHPPKTEVCAVLWRNFVVSGRVPKYTFPSTAVQGGQDQTGIHAWRPRGVCRSTKSIGNGAGRHGFSSLPIPLHSIKSG